MRIYLGGELSGLQPSSWSVTQEINKGWTASLEFAQAIDPDLWPAEATAVIALEDDYEGANPQLVTPTMALGQRSAREELTGEGTSISLVDQTSLNLSGGSESWDTFENSTSTAIASAVMSRFGVSGSGLAAYPVWKEDVKQSNGWSPLQRLALVAAQQIVTLESGSLLFVDNDWRNGSSGFLADSEQPEITPRDIYGKIFVSKNLGMGTLQGPWVYDFDTPGYPSTQLNPPVTGGSALDVSAVGGGRAAWLSYWDAQDRLIEVEPLSNGGLEAPNGLTVPRNGVWPAVRFSVMVLAAPGGTEVRVQISGTPPVTIPAGIDPAISREFGSGKGLPAPFSESLIPNEAWAEAHWEDWLREINRGKHVLRVAGPMNTGVRVGNQHGGRRGSGRIETVTWAGGVGQVAKTSALVELG